jgi:hypothetical protein
MHGYSGLPVVGKKANVLFLGSPYWCRHLVGLLNEHQFLRAYTWKNTLRWITSRNKSVCLVGLGAPDTYKRFLYHVLAYLMQKAGIIRKRVLYWIGSDVTRLKAHSRFVAGCLNIAGSSWLVEEVRENGLACEERLFPVKLPVNDVLPFPNTDQFQVLCYIPDAHHELHGSSEIRILTEYFADVEFTIIGGDGTWWPDSPGNIRFMGWVDDPVAYLAGAHIVLRRTAHDSLSAFVREALVAGRHVIFSYDFPGATYVKRGDIETLQARMSELNDRFKERMSMRNGLDPEVRNWLVDTQSHLRALAEDYG